MTIVPIARAQEEAKAEKADLPVKRVVMFSSGVTFFEHNGEVTDNATVDLQFRVDDVNDLLKSMVLQDLGGGRISTVSYDAKDPITRTLKTFAIDLTSNPTLADLLGQVRGEKVEIDAPTQITGTILGVEKHTEPAGDKGTKIVSYLNLLTEEGLRSVSLENVGRIRLLNPKVNADLQQALAVLAMSHSTDKKSVQLNFLGKGKRPVRVGYIQESPIWKTSYRLVLDDEAKPFLQGWAIVENTTESDWDKVNLTLVSGRPISFIMDLYQPLYASRPVVQPELYASLRPRVYDQDLEGENRDFAAAGEQYYKRAQELAMQMQGDASGRRRSGTPSAPDAASADRYGEGKGGGYLARNKDGDGERLNLSEGIQSVAQSGDVGEMFRYTIATPVTLQRSRSAMLPIVNESVEGEKVSIYNAGVHAKHPLNGLKLKNATELHLMQGPITVFDGGAYAGDAQIQALPPGSERLISYAMDLDTEVAPTSDSKPQSLVSVKIDRGTLYASYKQERTSSYTVKNSGKKVKKVLIELPLDNAWTLLSPKEPAEKTRDMYRFAVDAEPGKPADLKVVQERTINETVAVGNLNNNAIRVYLSSKVVSDEVKDALSEVVRRKAAISQVTAQITELNRQVQVIDQEQARIRQNMPQLPKESDLFRRYVTKFTEQEDQIDQLRTQISELKQKQADLQKALDDYISNLKVG